ncbi:M16 family metallopeptidase [Candidatus Deianiraea vastatrix]|uniref:M16-like zinc-protease n=1 Tax=Candidatus Deianiraea vastatrix TaxID=2163644 RepID=A0A5B8XFR8_9RICK|nr:pitrilysin family protein [Candidatus Deianiraea vastatrix]QED22847.1 Putative M16-like zinc-protease [Candidatus Deianiraea vastatrix]
MQSLAKTSRNIRVFTDVMKEVDTVSIVLGVKTGSRNENAQNNGISHFLEHMAFKGTTTRDYIELAEIVDNAGGSINAYTSKERTLYYIKLLKEDLELGIDILSDIFQNSIFPEEEIEKERGVILQELSMTMDTPDDVVFDYFYDTAFSNCQLGKTILGPAENIKNLQKKDFTDYLDRQYSIENSILSVCGNVDPDQVLRLAEKYLTKLDSKSVKNADVARYTGGQNFKHKDSLEQVQCLLGFESEKYSSEDIYKVSILSSILGSGMSSRLFQEIREKRGLVYTVSAWNDSYDDCGVFTIYAGTSPEKVDEFVSATRGELLKICENITDDEMKRVLKQAKAGIVMAKESTSSRAQKGCTDFLHLGRYLPYEEALNKIAAITKDDLYKMAQKIFKSTPTMTLYGNLKGVKSDVANVVIK